MTTTRIREFLRTLQIKNFFLLTLAGIINAIGVTMFLAPVNLYDSGISGTSILLSQITPQWLSLSVFLLILNVPLFLYGYKKQGLTFTVYAIYTVFIYSLSAFLITDILPVDVKVLHHHLPEKICFYVRYLRTYFRYWQWSCNKIWRCNGRYRSYGCNICQENWNYGWNIRNGI